MTAAVPFFFFFLYNRVCDYIAAGLDHKLVDPDGGIHLCCLQAQYPQVVSPLPHTLPSDGWTSSLQQLPPFSYGYLFAHLITNSETIAENQRSAATDIRTGLGQRNTRSKGTVFFETTM